jgi:hypothetical protein
MVVREMRTFVRNHRDALLLIEAAETAIGNENHSGAELVARIVGSLNPLLRSIRREIDYSIERWADEDAARTIGREITATALAATATTASPAAPAGALSHATSHVPERVRALLAEPHRAVARCSALLPRTPSSPSPRSRSRLTTPRESSNSYGEFAATLNVERGREFPRSPGGSLRSTRPNRPLLSGSIRLIRRRTT